jgi:hypothetical protein
MKWTVVAAISLISASVGVCIAQHYVQVKPSLVEGYVRSAAVFSGIAISCEQVPCVGFTGEACVQDRWEFKVGQVWKGPIVDRIYIYDMPDIGFRFKIGGHYLVYASSLGNSDAMYVRGNSRSNEVSAALVERYSLGSATVVDESLQLLEVTADEAAECLLRSGFRAPPDPAPCDTIILFTYEAD